ncbi:MAG: anti-sigma-factor antagonist [Frankiales bacterium]|nr:anti-sigma-factor antagonist [Frankiales bacterium]
MQAAPSPTGRVVVLELDGELDVSSAAEVRASLVGLTGVRLVVVDLARVTLVDGTVLGVLAGASRRAREEGGRLLLVNATGRVHKAIRLMGLAPLLFVPGQPDGSGPSDEQQGQITGGRIEQYVVSSATRLL